MFTTWRLIKHSIRHLYSYSLKRYVYTYRKTIDMSTIIHIPVLPCIENTLPFCVIMIFYTMLCNL